MGANTVSCVQDSYWIGGGKLDRAEFVQATTPLEINVLTCKRIRCCHEASNTAFASLLNSPLHIIKNISTVQDALSGGQATTPLEIAVLTCKRIRCCHETSNTAFARLLNFPL